MRRNQARRQTVTRRIPPAIYHYICDDNNQFLLDRQVIHRDFFGFATAALGGLQHVRQAMGDPRFGTLAQIQWATRFGFDLLAHAADNQHLPAFTNILCDLYRGNREACAWLLDSACSHPALVSAPLLTATVQSVREAMGQLLTVVLTEMIHEEADVLFECVCVCVVPAPEAVLTCTERHPCVRVCGVPSTEWKLSMTEVVWMAPPPQSAPVRHPSRQPRVATKRAAHRATVQWLGMWRRRRHAQRAHGHEPCVLGSWTCTWRCSRTS